MKYSLRILVVSLAVVFFGVFSFAVFSGIWIKSSWDRFTQEVTLNSITLPQGLILNLISVPTDSFNSGVRAEVSRDGFTVNRTGILYYEQTERYSEPFEWRYSENQSLAEVFYPADPDRVLFSVDLRDRIVLDPFERESSFGSSEQSAIETVRNGNDD
ncbi:MAG: hypothetical protein AAGJ81_13625 [Verrucomicrobiota bacterium]